MRQKAARSGGEARGACSLGAPLAQGVLGGEFVGTVGGAATRATVASEPVEPEEREMRAGCKRLDVVVCVLGPHSSSKRPGAGNMRASQRRCEVARGAEVFSSRLTLARPQSGMRTAADHTFDTSSPPGTRYS